MKLDTSSSSRLRYGLIALVLVALIVVLGFALRHRGASSTEEDSVKAGVATVEIASVEVRPVDTIVSAQGTLSASQGASAAIAPVSAGRLVSVRVREGDVVRAGQVVAVLDSRVPQAEAASASSGLRISQMQAQQTAIAEKAASTEYENAVETAKLELEIAQAELKNVESGARPQEIAQADQAVKQAQATRDRAATELDRVQFLFDKGIDSKRELDDAKTALSVADSALVSAREQASLVRAGARPEEVHTAKLRVKTAQTALRQAEQGVLEVAAKRQEKQAAIETIRQKTADLAAAQANAAYSELRSPITGRVTRRSLNPGDMADTSTPVVEIADTHSLNLVASIPAEDAAAIRVGMSARISAATAPGRVFTGVVLNVGEVDPQSGMLSVRLAIPNPSRALKVGAFATADIVVRTDPAALVVPKSAVITRNGRDVVFVVGKDSTAHQSEVTTGIEQGNVVEILKGIRQGDQVISLGQYELTDGAKVRPAEQTAKP